MTTFAEQEQFERDTAQLLSEVRSWLERYRESESVNDAQYCNIKGTAQQLAYLIGEEDT